MTKKPETKTAAQAKRTPKACSAAVGMLAACAASSAQVPSALGHRSPAAAAAAIPTSASRSFSSTKEVACTSSSSQLIPSSVRLVHGYYVDSSYGSANMSRICDAIQILRGGSSTEFTAEIISEQFTENETKAKESETTRDQTTEKRKKKKRSSTKSNKQQTNVSSQSGSCEEDDTNIGGIHRGGGAGTKESTMNKSAKTSKAQQVPKSDAQPETKNDSNNKSSNSSSSNNAASNKENNEDDSQSTHPLPPAAQSILYQTCHYDVLGITKQATQIEIQKAYRKRCVLTHPDKIPSGDRSAFDKVSEAYDVLSCERKRALYDRFGKQGVENGGAGGMGSGANGNSFFGNDVFRDFFGFSSSANTSGADPFSGRYRSESSSTNPFRRPPRNRDLRYQLEVTLEDLYSGTTKLVAIQQPNPLRPQFPIRKEVEVTLCPGMSSGESVRLAGVVDSIPDAAPADVVFLLSQRLHPVFTRRGYDLAMECKISLGEALVGFRRKILHLDGREIVIASPRAREDEKQVANQNNHNATASKDGAEEETTEAIQLPPVVVKTGDVHVLKGEGMPKKRSGDHGDLYIQYIVEMPGSTSKLQSSNLNAEERVELARLLRKLEGKGEADAGNGDCNNDNAPVHFLALSSASDFGSSVSHDDHGHDGNLRHDDDMESHAPHGFRNSEGVGDFFQKAFSGRSHGFGGGPFGSGSGGSFHYFSSSPGGGGGFGPSPFFNGQQAEEDHKMECNQM